VDVSLGKHIRLCLELRYYATVASLDSALKSAIQHSPIDAFVRVYMAVNSYVHICVNTDVSI